MRCRYLCIGLLCAIALSSKAQGNGFDMQLFSDPDLSGSSRYVGLGGAMVALGGDVSAVHDNPAAIAVFRRSEVMATGDVQLLQVRLGEGCASTAAWRIPEISWNFNFASGRQHRGVLYNNFVLSYKRLRTFDNECALTMSNIASSQTDLMAYQAAGLQEDKLSSVDAYDDSNVGWLAKAGYDAYMIDPDGNEDNTWHSCEDGNTNMQMKLSEQGSLDRFGMAWGMNISNRWYVGLGVDIYSLSYSKTVVVQESFESGNSAELTGNMAAKGLGIASSLGLIYRPTSSVRIGASFKTPVLYEVKTTSYGSYASLVQTEDGTERYSSASPTTYDETTKRRGAMVFSAGAAYQFANKGLVSLEYDYRHGMESNMRDEHMLRLGGEVVVARHCFINLGYATLLYGAWKQDESTFVPGYNSARMDTDFRNNAARHYVSAGVSYRGEYFVVGGAYQLAINRQNLWAYAGQEHAFDLQQMTHRVVLTLGWRYRR